MILPQNYENLNQKQRREVRLEYIKLQNNKCSFCKENLDEDPIHYVKNANIDLSIFPPGMLDHPIHLHHSHKTGMTLGAVHAKCNCYLWQFKGE